MKLKLLIIGILVVLTLVGYQTYAKYAALKSIDSYESCVASPGSLIQESYPATCVTRFGTRFIQPVPEELVRDNSTPVPLSSPNLKENKIFSHALITEQNGILNEISYSLEYPSNFTIMEQAAGTYALLVEPDNYDNIAFYIDERQMDIIWPKESQKKYFYTKNGRNRVVIICFNDHCSSPAYTQIINSFKFTD